MMSGGVLIGGENIYNSPTGRKQENMEETQTEEDRGFDVGKKGRIE